MNKPELLGLEVLSPDGRGEILTLHNRGLVVSLNSISSKQEMSALGRDHGNGGLHRFYAYKDVEIIKGRYNFIENPQSTKPIEG